MGRFYIKNIRIPRINPLELGKQGVVIVLGSVIFGFGLSCFLVPFKIAPGGVGGLSQILFHFFGLPVGVSMIMMNIPLWILGMVFVGRQFGIGTFAGFFTSAVAADLITPKNLYRWGIFREMFERYNTLPDGSLKPLNEWALTDSIFVASIAGALLLGVGIGIIFKARASTGGTDVPVAILKKHLHISMGNGYLIVETLIILFTGYMFRDINIIIWSYFGLFLSARFVDIVTEGISRVKAAYIIPTTDEKAVRIKDRITTELERGTTFLNGTGGYSNAPKKIIYVTFHVRQTSKLKKIVLEEDPQVFMVMHDVYDVIGYGFRTRIMEM